MKYIVLLLLLAAACGQPPLVIKDEGECWEPRPTGWVADVPTYAFIQKRNAAFVLQRCLWRPYGGLANATMRLIGVDTIVADSVDVLERRITYLPRGWYREELIPVAASVLEITK